MLIQRCRLDVGAAADHLGVDSYWDEYQPLLPTIEKVYRSEFGIQRLFLEGHNSYEALKIYISFLLSAADGIPVLQFNRVDFRLPWLQAHFPQAIIIHIYRDVREQWMSMVKNLSREVWDDPYENTPYDLIVWSSSLALHFPFLFSCVATTAYHRHYMLWKLSKLMGERCSDISISFDKLVESPKEQIAQLLKTTGLVDVDLEQLKRLIFPPERELWLNLVDENWFLKAEKECDQCLDQLGLTEQFGIVPLKSIKAQHKSQWNEYKASVHPAVPLLNLFREAKTKAFEIYNGTEPYVQTLKEERDGLAGLLQNAESERDRLAEHLKGVEFERDELENHLQALKTERDNCKIRLQSVSTERDGLAGLLQNAESERDRLAEHLKGVEFERDELERQLLCFPVKLVMNLFGIRRKK